MSNFNDTMSYQIENVYEPIQPNSYVPTISFTHNQQYQSIPYQTEQQQHHQHQSFPNNDINNHEDCQQNYDNSFCNNTNSVSDIKFLNKGSDVNRSKQENVLYPWMKRAHGKYL
jgi:hypothetical protein